MNKSEREAKEKQLERLNEQVSLVQKKLDLLELIDQTERELATPARQAPVTTPSKTHFDEFPIGIPVTFSNPREKRELKGKTGTVIGHSPKFVRVKSGRRAYSRIAGNLSRQDEPTTKQEDEPPAPTGHGSRKDGKGHC